MRQEETFLLRRWRDEPGEPWRMSLKDVKAGTTQFFHSDTELCRRLGIALDRHEALGNKGARPDESQSSE